MNRLAAMMIVAIGCGGGSGGGSGLPGDTRIADLTPGEVRQFCEYSLGGETRTIACPDGDRTIGGGDIDNCVDGFGEQQPLYDRCGLTVAELETCVDAFAVQTDDQICARDTPDECDAVVDCFE